MLSDLPQDCRFPPLAREMSEGQRGPSPLSTKDKGGIPSPSMGEG